MPDIYDLMIFNLPNEDIVLLSKLCRSPSKNDTYGSAEAVIKHLIVDRKISQTKTHFENGLTWDDDGNPVYNMPQKEDA